MLLMAVSAEAAHLVGGDITYQCTGNNNYTIKLRIYRDCNSSGAPFDAQAYIAIFNGATGVEVTSVQPSVGNIIQLPTTVSNPCLQTPPNVCTEFAIYTATVNLPPISGGYVISYQRCCRNQTISNIPNPGGWGSTYTVRIPPNDITCNSSPEFQINPPIVLCLNDTLNINSSALESDGDSLYYELCTPLHGGSQLIPQPVPPTPPPYVNVPFALGYSSTLPLPANPIFQINGQTGLITGKPTQTGQFVVGICVSEYRNGILLSKVLRDYQFNVTSCQSNVSAGFSTNVGTSNLICSGKTVIFSNTSFNGTKFFWDFGEPGTQSDTSNLRSPTHTFLDTGVYSVRLIVNPGWPCSDTITRTLEIRYPANAAFQFSGSPCLNAGTLNFTTTSLNTPKDTYTWDFGLNAFPGNSTLRDPPPIAFTAPGKHVVSLTVNSFGCITTVYDTVEIFLQPEIDFLLANRIGCAPYTVTFQDNSSASTGILYAWDFGDGNTSTQQNPSHTYQNPGTYDVALTIFVTEGCTDTLSLLRPAYVTVNPTPTAAVSVTPVKTSIYESLVEVNDLNAKIGESFFTDMGDGITYSNQPQILHQYRDTGTYMLTHVVYNGFNCADTVVVPVRINPVPLIFAPSAFSPNNDGVNDIYKPSIVGAATYKLYIYSRWGEVVFYSEDPNESWNGQLNNTGKELPVGVYSYAIYVRDINDEYSEKKGYITLMR